MQANGDWSPQQYVKLALWYDHCQGKSWDQAPPQETVSFQRASATRWQKVGHANLSRHG